MNKNILFLGQKSKKKSCLLLLNHLSHWNILLNTNNIVEYHGDGNGNTVCIFF